MESAYKKVKAELQPLVGTITSDDIANMITTEVAKIAPNVPVDTIVKFIQQELGKLSLSINVATPTPQPEPTSDSPTEVES